MDTIKGSLEIITGTEPNTTSQSTTVEAALPSIVPTIVQALYGLTNLTPATADPAQPAQVAAWTTTDSKFLPVRVILWRQPAFDETTIGKALKAAHEGGAS